jgi:hypothetical protein
MADDERDPQAEAVARGDVIPEETPVAEDPPAEDPPAAAAAEEDPAAEATAESEPEPEAEPEKGHMIPKTRFDQAVGKERSRAEIAEAELNKYRQRDQMMSDSENFEAAQAKVKELLGQHSSLLADGELEKASDVMEAVLQLRDDMQNVRMARQADNARNSAKIEVEYDRVVEQLETAYPEINPDDDAFDQSIVANVQAMVTGIMQTEGKNPAEALVKATDILLKPLKDAKGETLRDKPSEEAIQQGMRRQQAQIDKNLEAAERQPPSTAEVGQDHDKTGGALDAEMVANMSWEEFVNIPDEELAKMRGDFVQ